LENEEIQEYQEKIFEDIKHIDEEGNEYWLARELMKALKYAKWQNFEKVIDKAKIALEITGNKLEDWVTDVSNPIITGKGKQEIIKDYKLSRLFCYLIVQNGDPRKEEIALGQKYFAIQTRKAEIIEDYLNEKRILERAVIKKSNLELNQTAKNAGVKNFDKFTNAGFKGLYNGETADDIAKRKELRYREEILDNMCSDELIANQFRISLTNQKLKQDSIKGEKNACDTHYKMGTLVRNTIKEAGTTLPENFETPKKSLKEIKKEELKKIKGGCINLIILDI